MALLTDKRVLDKLKKPKVIFGFLLIYFETRHFFFWVAQHKQF
jgi:hypothetical protein